MNIRLRSRLLISLSILAIQAPAILAEDAVEVKINNDGVRALKAADFEQAIEKFKQALRIDPSYKLARANLAIAYNNLALKKVAQPKEALKLFHLAAYLEPDNKTTLLNVSGVIRILGRKPNSFQDRVDLGDEAMKNDDFAGGLLEYEAALSIKDDAGVREKLSRVVVPKEWSAIVNDHAAVSSAPKESKGPDFTAYMTNLQGQIKSHWHPPRQPKAGSDQAEVTFKVAASGQASEVKITKSTGLADADQAALKAVADAAPFSALPAGSPSSVDVQFTFTYTEAKAGAAHEDAAHWRQRVAALEQSGGKNLALALVKLADCDESDGRYAQAEPLYIRAIKILDSSKTASAEDLSSAVSSLGDLYYSDLDRYAEAETQYRRALSLVQKDSDHAENDLGVAQYRLGSALVAQENKYSEAISLLRSALAIIGRHPDLGEQWHSAATVALANAYWGDSENEKALPLYQSALQLAEKMAPDNPKDLPQRIKDVADCLAQLDRNQEALPLYERALALFKKSAKPDRDDVSAVEQAIASIKDGSTTPAESAATNKSAATTTTTATGSHAAVPKDKDNDGETLEKWLPFVLGLACLILGLLWYRDRKRDPNPPK